LDKLRRTKPTRVSVPGGKLAILCSSSRYQDF